MRQLNKRDAWQLAVAGVALGKRLHHIRQGNLLCVSQPSVISAVTTAHKDEKSPKIHLMCLRDTTSSPMSSLILPLLDPSRMLGPQYF